jgi:hypothetical protein
MWVKRKSKNRRIARERVLDVKMRSSQVRAARIRIIAVGLGSLFTLVLVAFLLWRGGDWVFKQLVYENEAFAVRELDIETDGGIPIEQIRRWAGIKLGENLFALDHSRVRRDLEMVPRIELASVQKILPSTVRVRIIERAPVARVNLPRPRTGGGVELVPLEVDANGWVMSPLGKRDPVGLDEYEMPLPVLSGISPSEVHAGRQLESPRVQAALRFLQAFDRSPMAGLVDLQRIDLSSPGVLIVTTATSSEITFGLNDPEQQLLRWREIFDLAQRSNKLVASLDLAVTNYIPLRYWEEAIPPSVLLKMPKAPKTRKKHV